MTTATTMMSASMLALAAAMGVPLLAAACFALWWALRRRKERSSGAQHFGEKLARSALKTRVLSLARPHSRSGETPRTGEQLHPAQGGLWLRHMAAPGQPPSAEQSVKSVLVADDDVYVNHWLSVRLRELGLDVVATTDAVNALLGAERFHPDLIVLDVNMPTGNGAALCELLATNQELRGVPIIMYTGVADAKTRYRCQSLGARYVMKEPGSWSSLRREVCELLGLPAAHESVANPNAALQPAIPDGKRRSPGTGATHAAALPGA
jgi:CheY-like chemotaxis protein